MKMKLTFSGVVERAVDLCKGVTQEVDRDNEHDSEIVSIPVFAFSNSLDAQIRSLPYFERGRICPDEPSIHEFWFHPDR